MRARSRATGSPRWLIAASPTAAGQPWARTGTRFPEAAPALRRADTGAETRGSKGGGASPCQTATLNVAWAGLRTLLRA